MKHIISAMIALVFTQAAMANLYRGRDLKQIDCLGSNGVQYKITQTPNGPLCIETSYGAIQKTFFGNSSITSSHELNILMGTDKSGSIPEYQLVLPLSQIEVEKQGSTGMAYVVSFNNLIPIGSVTCSVQYTKRN